MAETNAEEILNQDEVQEQDPVETETAEEAAEQETEEAPSEAADTDQDEKKDKKGFFKKKKDKKDEQIEELNDRLKRNMAEFDNFRKRTEKEKAAMFEVGAKSVVEKILPVVDNFERGLATVPEEEKEAPFVQGMDKTYKQLIKMLEDMEVVPIEAVGQEFDPAFHNAVMHVDDESAGDNVVVEEFQKGYTYRGNVVRFSMVKVAN
ncbi:MAG: nucleotide exchange factor GrpE [Lachnospiraceae bacterium]|nr:nucleotide exchange factor GrpE [Lachnospiraceae bacterium]MDY4970320.1 nucleotide exchange factor GrpE [Lachnospiraceae bacterium]